MLEALVLGLAQGVTEWLPVSSTAVVWLLKEGLFGSDPASETLRLALFLHLGTVLAAAVYLWRDVLALTRALIRGGGEEPARRRTLWFLIVSTAITGAVGVGLMEALEALEPALRGAGRAITAGIGGLLLVTAALQWIRPEGGLRGANDLRFIDGILLGFVQGLAVLPGLSRSGLTVPTLLLRRVDDEEALRLSFLMSLPVVLGGNVVLNAEAATPHAPALIGLGASFLAGLATIHVLLRLARRLDFAVFVLVFGLATLLAAVLQGG